MDKKLPSNLDPKLKEVYERVMNTPLPKTLPQPPSSPLSTSPSRSNNALNNQAPKVNPAPITPMQKEKTVSSPSPSLTPQPVSNTIPSTPKATSFTLAHNLEDSKGKGKKNQSVFPLIVAVLFLVFLVVYTLFWVKFFNFSLPLAIPF